MAKDLELEKKTPVDASEKSADDSAKKQKNAKDSKAKKAKSGKPKKSVVKYFKDAKSEFKKVVWPTPKQTTHNTIVVIVMCALAALFIFGIDSLFGLLNKLILG